MANPEGKNLTQYTDGLYFEGIPYTIPQFNKLGIVQVDYLKLKPVPIFTPYMSETYHETLPSEGDVITVE